VTAQGGQRGLTWQERRARRRIPTPFDLDSLAEVMRVELHEQSHPGAVRAGVHADRSYDPSLHGLHGAMVALLEVDFRHLKRAMAEGLSDRQADRYAVRCRLHPSLVWGSLWWRWADPRDEVAPPAPAWMVGS